MVMAFGSNVIKQTRHSRPRSNVSRTVFYFPGIFGDEPNQAMLREQLGDHIKFHVITLPDLEKPISTLCNMHETGRLIAKDVSTFQQQGDIYILGFSFGAILALEVAYQLTYSGRFIAYLGLIDGNMDIDDTRYSVRGILYLIFAPRIIFILSKYLRQIVAKIFRFLDISTYKRLDGKLSATDCRFIALKNWKARPSDAHGLILQSIFFYERSSAKWREKCPNCKQVRILSDHHNVITGSSLHRVASLIADSIAGIA